MPTPHSLQQERFQKMLANRQAVKVISGIANTNLDNIMDVVRAAEAGGAHAVDVCANPAIVAAVRQTTNLFVFASAVDAQMLLAAVDAGADGVEVGNYDALYAQGRFIEASQVLETAKTLVQELKGKALISITIPGHLSTEAQVSMARELETLGVDVIQTEGAVRALSAEAKTVELTAAEKAAVAIENVRLLSLSVSTPVMAASGMSSAVVAEAIQAGASAIGLGSAVNKAETFEAMVAEVKASVAQAQMVSSQNKEAVAV